MSSAGDRVGNAAQEPLVVAFSGRELEIMRLLSDGLSNREIAQQLYLTVETVKWYNKQIYARLEVSSRTQAIARARSLGLLDAPPQAGPVSIPSPPRHNLTPQPTPFVGRERELSDLARLFEADGCRMVTLLGPGGIGKTRLGLAYAERQIGRFAHGVFAVSLAPVSSAEHIVPAAAHALGFQFYEGGEPGQQLLDYLRHKDMLLVLDNFEHLPDGAGLVGDILNTAPGVRVLATSRQRLKLAAECGYEVGGMESPQDAADEVFEEFEAVRLFVTYARRARPGYQLAAAERPAIARLCRMVGGMPLGLELAAAWTRALTPDEIVNELAASLDFLHSDMAGVPERQRSLRAAFDHSWRLLNEDEQAALMKFAVFRGGATRQAAQAVTGASLHTLTGLVDWSLLTRSPETGRFTIHETVRQFGVEKLEGTGEADAVRDAHAACFAEFVAERDIDAGKYRQKELANDIDADFDNITAAWHRALARRHLGPLLKMVIPVWEFSWLRQYRADSIMRFFEETLHELESDSHSLPVRSLYARLLSCLAPMIGRHRGEMDRERRLAEQGLALALDAGDEPGLAVAQASVGFYWRLRGQRLEEALALFEASAAICQRSGLLSEAGWAVWHKAWTLAAMGARNREVEIVLQDSLALSRQAGDRWLETSLTRDLGSVKVIQGEYGQAMDHFQESLSTARQQGLHELVSMDLAVLNARQGDYEQARTWCGSTLEVGKSYGELPVVADATTWMAQIASLEGRHEQAIELLDESCRIFPAIQDDPSYVFAQGELAFRRGDFEAARRRFESLLGAESADMQIAVWLALGLAHARLGNLEAARHLLSQGLGAAFRVERRFKYPQALYAFAEILRATGRAAEAVELGALIVDHRVTFHEYQVYAAALLKALESDVPPEVYRAAYERGRSRDLDTTVQVLLEGEFA